MKSGTDILGIGKLRVSVTSGPSAGASALLSHSGCKIGSGGQDDMILLAYDLFEGHLSLETSMMPLAPLRVKALAGSVRVGNREIDPGQYLDVSTPASISAGGCDLRIERPGFTKAQMRWAGSVTAIGLIAIAGYALLSARAPIATDFQPVQAPVVMPAPASDAAIRAKLAELGLATQITLKTGADGSITLSGHFSSRTADAWRQFLQWYDAQTDLPQILNAVTRADDNEDMPKIASVWAQEPAELVMEDGRVVRIGEQLDANWKFEGLSETGIEISRNGTKVVIEF